MLKTMYHLQGHTRIASTRYLRGSDTIPSILGSEYYFPPSLLQRHDCKRLPFMSLFPGRRWANPGCSLAVRGLAHGRAAPVCGDLFDMRLGSITNGAGPLVAPDPRTFVEHLRRLPTAESQSGQQVFQYYLINSTKTKNFLTIC